VCFRHKKKGKERKMLVAVQRDENCEYCEQQKNIWGFLDAAVMITLRERADRQKIGLAELHKCGLCQIAHVYLAERDPRGFIIGCWDSTARVCQLSLQAGFQTVLSLEDDFELDPLKKPEVVAQEVREGLRRLPPSWQRFSLGHQSWAKFRFAKGVDRAMSMLNHAHIWSTRGMQWMSAQNMDKHLGVFKRKNMEQVDHFTSTACANNYALTPMVAFQKNLSTDRAANTEWVVMREFTDTTEWLFPLVWAVVVIALFALLAWALHRLASLPMISAVVTSAVVVGVPFFTVWILVLTNHI
jgi:hypothetical protein